MADPKLGALEEKYAEEAAKRLRPDGTAQFIELRRSDDARIRSMAEDPWADHDALDAQQPAVVVDDDVVYKVVIVGAGFGGLLFAAHLIDSGAATADDIRFLDAAGGFGGTWYWNRYPGLQCDIESYVYMPLLEQTGYMPTTKYASGEEIRKHAERIASHWNLTDKALFRAGVEAMAWDEATQLWKTRVAVRSKQQPPKHMLVRSQYIYLAGGVLARPQVPQLPGLENFAGPMFHSSRWDYALTGGSPASPTLTGLSGKRVAILGTGATAIQILPDVAKTAEAVFVFQRTPSYVRPRDQRQTDAAEFRTKIAYKTGWQAERAANFNAYLTNSPIANQTNMVDDEWTRMPAMSALIGSPNFGTAGIDRTGKAINSHIQQCLALDLPSTERTRKRVDELIRDSETAAKLKPWYPTWCKRSTFSDTFLQTFNEPHVHLVDTNGKGVSRVTERGLLVGDSDDAIEYPVDMIILCTGYRTPAISSPAAGAQVEVLGHDSVSMDVKFKSQGVATLHGIATNGFPNFFFSSHLQGPAAGPLTMTLEASAIHVAYIIAEAERRMAATSNRPVIEVMEVAEEAYTAEIQRRSLGLAPMGVCTPGYLTAEGEHHFRKNGPKKAHLKGRGAVWGDGFASYAAFVEAWRADGSLKGLSVSAATGTSPKGNGNATRKHILNRASLHKARM